MDILWMIEDEIDLSRDFKNEIEDTFNDISVKQFYNMTDLLRNLDDKSFSVPFLIFADIKLHPIDDKKKLIDKTGIKVVHKILENERLKDVPVILFTHLGITEKELLELDHSIGTELRRRYSNRYMQLKSFNDITIKKISPEATARRLKSLISNVKN